MHKMLQLVFQEHIFCLATLAGFL